MKIKITIIMILSTVLIFTACSKKDKSLIITKQIIIEDSKKLKKIKKNVIQKNFFITIDDLDTITQELPAQTKLAINSNNKEFLLNIKELLLQPVELTWLIDKKNPIKSIGYEPLDLVYLNKFKKISINNQSLKLRSIVISDLRKMASDCSSLNLDLKISSAYRSYNYQQLLFKRWTKELGEKEAERVSARAGSSQHQLGTTIDFGSISVEFANSDEGKWILENGWKYGFSLSYPKNSEKMTGYSFEPWHYRYIGISGAKIEKIFFNSNQQEFLIWWDKNKNYFVENFLEDDSEI